MGTIYKRARSGSGLGDNLYLQSIVRWLVAYGELVEVCTSYPQIFHSLVPRVQFAEFSRRRIDYTCHYVRGKRRTDTTQWEDICDSARVPRSVPLRLDWKVVDEVLPNRLREKAKGMPIVLSLQHRAPMARTDGYGAEVLPQLELRRQVLEMLPNCFIVEVGKGESLGDLPHHWDLRNKTTLWQLLDIAASCDGMVAYPSFVVPLAESLGIPALFVWSSRIRKAKQQFIRAITPQKVLHQPNLYVYEHWANEKTEGIVRYFRYVLNGIPARAAL